LDVYWMSAKCTNGNLAYSNNALFVRRDTL